MKDYGEKLNIINDKQNHICPVCKSYLCINIDLHHKIRNTKGNRKRYPLMIDSIYNLEAIHHDCHIMRHGEAGKMTDIEAKSIEEMLREKYTDKEIEQMIDINVKSSSEIEVIN